jgi:hypothetical protein
VFGRAPTCNLQVDLKHVALHHARLDRIKDADGGIRVENISDGKNDIVFNGEIAKKTFTMQAGDWFEIGEYRYFALSDEMRLAQPVIMEILGFKRQIATDELLITSAINSSKHIMLTGERGSDQERLGHAIHRISHRRENPFRILPDTPKIDSTTRKIIEECYHGTLMVSLYERGALSQRLVGMITDPSARVRLVICAPTRHKIAASFSSTTTDHATETALTPLRERTAEIPSLMDQWFIESGSPIRFGALPEATRTRLKSYTWPNNLLELKQSANYFVELAKHPSARQAARCSNITRGQLRTWCDRLNISIKLPLIPNIDK